MLFQSGRAVRRLPQLGSQPLTKSYTHSISSRIQRVAALYHSLQSHTHLNLVLCNNHKWSTQCRSYATKPVSRPKAHTGRTTATARKPATTSKTKAAKAPAVRNTTPKKKPTAKSTGKPKAKPKAKPKVKAKLTKAKKPKKTLTEAEKNRATIKELKVTALSPPAGLAATTWNLFLQDKTKGHKREGQLIGQVSKEVSAQFKTLAPEQVEVSLVLMLSSFQILTLSPQHYNHIVNQNRAKNETAYRQFIESHTPAVIRAANNARLNLRRRKVRGFQKQLQDHRQVKSPRSSYISFYQERMATGDFRGLKMPEATKLASREWKALSEAEKKVSVVVRRALQEQLANRSI